MSKLDQYQAAKALASDARDFADSVNENANQESPRYLDKLGFRLNIAETWQGRYGSSSTYSWPRRMVEEFERQIGVDKRELIERMAVRLEREAEARRIEAADEAREVLGITGNEI